MIVESIAPPLGVNAHFETGSFLWFTLALTDFDLQFESAHFSEIGEMPELLTEEFNNLGIAEIIQGSRVYDTRPGGFEFSSSNLHWALENGIAPGQRFCVWVARPRYSRPSYWDGEVDVEFDAWVVKIEPWSPARITRWWAKTLRNIRDDRDKEIAARLELRKRQHTDTAAWFLRESWMGRYNTRLDLLLCSSHTRSAWPGNFQEIARGMSIEDESLDTIRTTALNALCAQVLERFGVAPEVIRALPRKR